MTQSPSNESFGESVGEIDLRRGVILEVGQTPGDKKESSISAGMTFPLQRFSRPKNPQQNCSFYKPFINPRREPRDCSIVAPLTANGKCDWMQAPNIFTRLVLALATNPILRRSHKKSAGKTSSLLISVRLTN